MSGVIMGDESIEGVSDSAAGLARARSVRIWLVLIVLVGLVAYLPTFVSLAASTTGGQSYYDHWFLIPPVSFLFIWMKRQRLRELPVERFRWGLALVIGGLVLHVFAVWFRVDFVSAFALVVTVWGLCLYFFGRRIVREIWFPLLFLLFMVPLPGTLIAPIAFHMKVFAGKIAVRLYNLLGGTALLTGSKISFVSADPLWMGYECSGLRSVISLSALGAAIAYLVRISWPRKVLLFLSSFPLAIASNAIRVASLCFAAERWGVKTRAYQVFHDVSSPVVFLIVLAGLFGIYKLLSLGSRGNEPETQTPDKPSSPSAEQPLMARITGRKLKTLFAILVVSAILVVASPHFMAMEVRMSSLSPVELPARVGPWREVGEDSTDREDVFSILNTRSIVLKGYQKPEGGEVEVLVVASDTDRQAFHPPEICMIGAGNEVLERWQETILLHSSKPRQLAVNAFVRGTGGRPETLVLYWYMAGKESTGSRTRQQFVLLLNGAKRVPAIGAMIRLTADLTIMSRDEALPLATEFIASLVPLMPDVLKTARRTPPGDGD
jgi:EpsI family protein